MELTTVMEFAIITQNLCMMEVAIEMKLMQIPQEMKSVRKDAT